MTIPPGTPIRRKEHVPDSVRTEKKDEAADVIEELWPAPKTEIADVAGCSRTHIDNVLEDYFEEIQHPGVRTSDGNGRPEVRIEIPDDAEEDSYLRGYFDGFIEGKGVRGGDSDEFKEGYKEGWKEAVRELSDSDGDGDIQDPTEA